MSETADAPCPDDDCDFVAKNEFGLGAHVRAKHGPTPTPVAGPPEPVAAPAPPDKVPSPAPEPLPTPDGGSRRFRCKRYPKQVLAPAGKTIARFVDGELTTEDPRVIELCEGLEYVEEVT